jgi:signal transduction histidine kinase
VGSSKPVVVQRFYHYINWHFMDGLPKEITLIILFSVFLLTVGIGIIMLVLIYQKKQSQYTMDKRQLQSNFQKELLKTQLETQEETFHQISEELHDNIGQLLSSTRMLLGITERSLSHVPDTLRTADQTLAKAIQDLRMLSKSLNKEWLHQFNVIQNLEAEIERINSAQVIQIELRNNVKILPLPPESQVMLFRIIQEALQNCIRHSNAENALINISSGDFINISINDNGSGFTDAEANKGVGLMNMKHRTKLLGGAIEWKQGKDKGTEVSIVIPVQNENT